MAFLRAPCLPRLKTPFHFTSCFSRTSIPISTSLSIRCTAQTPVTPSHQHYRPRETNFFRETDLSRLYKPTFPTNIGQLIQSAARNDRFIPIWNEKAIVSKPSNAAEAGNSKGPINVVKWTPSQLKAWFEEIRHTLNPQFSPLAVLLAHSNSFHSQPPTNYFAVDVSSSAAAPITTNESVLSLRRALPLLDAETDATLLAHANALITWHNSAVFCSRCGKPTIVTQSGTARACNNDACRTKNIYPRVMPSVLVLVLRNNGQEVLLGRKASWAEGRYSVLAGFSEIFESLEQTVAREVFEETGVQVDQSTISYHSSQPWPSQPHASLMSGFRAHVTERAYAQIRVDRNELEDARWFKKSWLRKALDSSSSDGPCVSIPGPTSLAHRLIQEWLHETAGDGNEELSDP